MLSRPLAGLAIAYSVFCVFFPFILDIKFVGRTSRGHTGFFIHLSSALRALILLARRIQPFLSLVDREVIFLCTNDLEHNRSPLVGLFFFFNLEKFRLPESNSRPNVSEKLRGYLWATGATGVRVVMGLCS